jgi:hypothetical protein
VKIDAPASSRAGDLLVAAESANQANTGWSTPGGWTYGGGGQLDGQDLNWWWKVASQNEPKKYSFKHSRWADGGMFVLDFANTSATPIRGASSLGLFDNSGWGYVTQATCGSVSAGAAASLLILGWQPTSVAPSWPAGYTTVATDSDGYGYVAAATNIKMAAPAAQTIQMNPAQAVVLSLQITFR